jgi:hypothetical protein
MLVRSILAYALGWRPGVGLEALSTPESKHVREFVETIGAAENASSLVGRSRSWVRRWSSSCDDLPLDARRLVDRRDDRTSTRSRSPGCLTQTRTRSNSSFKGACHPHVARAGSHPVAPNCVRTSRHVPRRPSAVTGSPRPTDPRASPSGWSRRKVWWTQMVASVLPAAAARPARAGTSAPVASGRRQSTATPTSPAARPDSRTPAARETPGTVGRADAPAVGRKQIRDAAGPPDTSASATRARRAATPRA